MPIHFSRLMPTRCDYLIIQIGNKFYLVKQDGDTCAECVQKCFSANEIKGTKETRNMRIDRLLRNFHHDDKMAGRFKHWCDGKSERKRRIAEWEAQRKVRDQRGTYLQGAYPFHVDEELFTEMDAERAEQDAARERALVESVSALVDSIV